MTLCDATYNKHTMYIYFLEEHKQVESKSLIVIKTHDSQEIYNNTGIFRAGAAFSVVDSSGDSLLLLNTSLFSLFHAYSLWRKSVCLCAQKQKLDCLFIFVTSLTQKNLQSNEFIGKSPEPGRSENEREEDGDKSCQESTFLCGFLF